MDEPLTPSAPELLDGGMICPTCDYDLTGLPENRCPECGNSFDPDVIRRLTSSEVQLYTPWDRVGGRQGWWDTFVLTLTKPAEFARNFPARHDKRSVNYYAIACYGLGAVAIGLAITIRYLHPLAILSIVLAMLGVVTASWIFESAVAGMLSLWVKPTLFKRNSYHFWRGLTHYSSGFTLLAAIWFALLIVLLGLGEWLRTDGMLAPLWFELMCSVVLVGAWILLIIRWWVVLARMISARSRPGGARVAVILAIPAIGFFSILMSLMVTGLGCASLPLLGF